MISGLLDLPWGVKFSTLTKLGTGAAFQVFDASVAPFFDPRTNQIYSRFPDKNCISILARCEVDITFEKEFGIMTGHRLSLAVDVFNLFNNKNYTGFGGFVCCGEPASNFRLGEPNSLLTLPRRLQLRAAYRF